MPTPDIPTVREPTQLTRLARENTSAIKCVIFVACLLPAGLLFHGAINEALGINPLNRLLHDTGRCALYLLFLTLTVTPLRRLLARCCTALGARDGKRLSDWNWLVRLRRMLGLFSFFYACAHATIYVTLDAAAEFDWVIEDLSERPFILVGAIALLALLPLAATSTDAMMRRLGRRWRSLHRMIYPIAMLGVLHFWWSAKVGATTHLYAAGVLAVLLVYRLLAAQDLLIRRPRDDGMEVPARPNR
jgi:sulfoxide reductase heme-binding subunit YedZ